MATMRFTFIQTLQSQVIQNTFHVAGGDAVQANAQAIGDYWRSIYASQLQLRLANNWSLDRFKAKELDVVTNPTIEYNFTAGQLVGTNTNTCAPNQLALLVRWTALTARPNRGRTYVAGLCVSDLGDDGRWGIDATADVQSWAEGMLDVSTAFTGLAMTITRVSRTTGILVGSNLIDQVAALRNPATQRRRRIGVGQ